MFRTRDLLVRQRTQVINALRGHFAEFGIVVAKGPQHAVSLAARVEDPASDLPEAARTCLAVLTEELRRLDERIGALDREIMRRAKADEAARRLMTIPGIGPVTATALLALAPAAATFRSRDIQKRTRLRRLARPDAGAAFERRQGAPRANLEDG